MPIYEWDAWGKAEATSKEHAEANISISLLRGGITVKEVTAVEDVPPHSEDVYDDV